MSISKLKKKADVVFKKYIRTRDGRCLHCGRTTNLQASHTIPVSKGNRLRYDERNVITLCHHCHLNWWHKNPLEGSKWFKETFPQDYEYLQFSKNERLKFTEEDLKELIDMYKEKTSYMIQENE